MAVKNMITILLGTWLICGIFVDGFAHNHGVVETFFTPWHALLYSGYLATAMWMMYITYQNAKKQGKTLKQGIPDGYGLGIVGVVVFLVGGLCDMIWHVVFGVEEDIAALLSPSHLLLLLGVFLIITSPFRMGWRNLDDAPRLKDFFPALLSITFTISMAGFFLMYAWSFNEGWVATTATANEYNHSHGDHHGGFYGNIIVIGVINTLITTTLMMAPIYFLLRRWKLPFGTVTIIFTIEFALMSALRGFTNYPVIFIAVLSGLVADAWLKKSDKNLRLFSLVIPMLVWGMFYAGVAFFDGMGWDPEIWSGSIVLGSLWSLGLHLLAFPPSHPSKIIESTYK